MQWSLGQDSGLCLWREGHCDGCNQILRFATATAEPFATMTTLRMHTCCAQNGLWPQLVANAVAPTLQLRLVGDPGRGRRGAPERRGAEARGEPGGPDGRDLGQSDFRSDKTWRPSRGTDTLDPRPSQHSKHVHATDAHQAHATAGWPQIRPGHGARLAKRSE